MHIYRTIARTKCISIQLFTMAELMDKFSWSNAAKLADLSYSMSIHMSRFERGSRYHMCCPVEAEEQEVAALTGDVVGYGWRAFAAGYMKQR